jgi:hypothetical protein
MLDYYQYQKQKTQQTSKYYIYIKRKFNYELSNEFDELLTEKGQGNLDYILDQNLDISDLINTYDLIQEANSHLYKHDFSKYAFIGYSVLNNSLTQGYSRYNKTLVKILDSYSDLNAKLPQLKQMSRNYSGSYRKNFDKVSGYELRNFEKHFNEAKELRAISKDRSFKYGEYRSRVHMNRYNLKDVEIYLGSDEDATKLAKIANFGNIVQHGLFTLGVVTGSYEVYQAYQNGQDPYKKAAEITGSAIGSSVGASTGGYIASVIIGASISGPVGWAGIGAYAVVAGIGAYLGGIGGEKAVDWVYDAF